MKIFGIVGWKNSGKTFFAEKIINKLSSLDFKIASIKHAHHDFDIDHPNTDSYIHRNAGSQEVIISSSKRWAKITELKNSNEKNLEYLIKQLTNPDIVIVEGFKTKKHPKIEIIKDPLNMSTYMFNAIDNITAIVSDIEIKSFKKKQFKKNQINEICNHILEYKHE